MRVLAYLDAGTASMVVQGILGGTAAVLVSIKMFGKRVFRKLFFWRNYDEEDEKEDTAASEPAASQNGAGAEADRQKEPVS